MSVTSVKEDYERRTAQQSVALGATTMKNVTTYGRSFVVQVDDSNDDGQIVLAHSSIPKAFDTYTSGNGRDTGAYCIRRTPTQDKKAPLVWRVQCDYTTDLPDPGPPVSGGGSAATVPTLQPTRYSLGYTTISRVLEKDFDHGANHPARAVVNSAWEKFNPPFEREVYLQVITVQKVEDWFLGYSIFNITGYINEGSFSINGQLIGDGKALARVRQAPFFFKGLPYWDTSYEFTINEDGWALKPLDQGTRKRVAASGGSLYDANAKLVVITDQFGQPMNHPVNLDGQGQPLALNANPVFLDGTHGANSDFGPFYPYPSKPFRNF